MIFNTLTYRLLTTADNEQYLNFIKSFDSLRAIKGPGYMSSATKSAINLDVALEDMIGHENVKIAGAFDGNTLVAAISGYFTDAPVWYTFNQHSKVNTGSLFASVDFLISSMKIHRVLMEYAEGEGIFNFYVRRKLKTQRSIDKVTERIIAKGYIEFRYERYFDGFYPIGKEISRNGHDFFRANELSDSVVSLYCLKQSEREKIMDLKFPGHYS